MTKNVYYGIFFAKEDVLYLAEKLGFTQLEKVVGNPHVTFAFGQEMTEGFKKMVGAEASVSITGHGNDGKNEGFAVVLDDKNEFLLKVPHITISIADGAKAVDTANLDFKALPFKRLKLKGKYGWFGSDGTVHFE